MIESITTVHNDRTLNTMNMEIYNVYIPGRYLNAWDNTDVLVRIIFGIISTIVLKDDLNGNGMFLSSYFDIKPMILRPSYMRLIIIIGNACTVNICLV